MYPCDRKHYIYVEVFLLSMWQKALHIYEVFLLSMWQKALHICRSIYFVHVTESITYISKYFCYPCDRKHYIYVEVYILSMWQKALHIYEVFLLSIWQKASHFLSKYFLYPCDRKHYIYVEVFLLSMWLSRLVLSGLISFINVHVQLSSYRPLLWLHDLGTDTISCDFVWFIDLLDV